MTSSPMHPWPPVLGRSLDGAAAAMLWPEGAPRLDLSRPAGELGLFGSGSVAWRVFRNPVALLVGGVAAVLLELAHPAVRAGVWTHSSFRTDPIERIRRTGHAAMLTVYAPRSVAEPAIARVVRRHRGVRGVTPDGTAYSAVDPDLLVWVHATATFGFTTAYDRYVAPLGDGDLSRAFAEALPAARLYGAHGAPSDADEWRATLERTMPMLGPSPVVGEFLEIMRGAPLLPRPLRLLQRLAVRGAVDLLPGPVRDRMTLGSEGLPPGGRALLRSAGALAERTALPSHPAVQAARRLAEPEPPGGGTVPDPRPKHVEVTKPQSSSRCN